ncbi:MAG: hypothetical protein K8R58_04545 [Bacteroidales bacterium]|nr:hypothetical protein [Bacteroidales bacterium]
MDSVIITGKSRPDTDLLIKLAKKMKFDIQVISDEAKEDLGLLKIMNEARKTPFISLDEVKSNLK